MALQIIGAVYGNSTQGRDVTSHIRTNVSNGNDDVQVTNEWMLCDPVPGQPKKCTVVYFNGNECIARSGDEGTTIDLAP